MRDRIAASAREKLGQVDKEKQLQAERKKRAAMFINMLKGSNTDGGGAQTNDKGWFVSVFELHCGKTKSVVSEQVRHKPTCTSTENC